VTLNPAQAPIRDQIVHHRVFIDRLRERIDIEPSRSIA
jgi:hypothetical protein